MEFIIVMIVTFVIIAILTYVFGYNKKEIEGFAKDEELDEKVKKYPSNLEMCKTYLNMLGNENVEVEEEKDSKTCLYIAITNKIVIGNIKDSYTRIQTIAHECIHSVQDKKLLLCNFIFSNIYLAYFFMISVIAVIGILPYKMMFLSILLLLSMVYMLIRNYLENDAMIKAKFLAKEYMVEQAISNEQEMTQIVNKFDAINQIGIKCVNYHLFLGCMWKVLIFSVICMFN